MREESANPEGYPTSPRASSNRQGSREGHTGDVVPLGKLIAGFATVVVLAGCGGGSDSESAPRIAGNADPGDVRVIDAWVTALRRGDVDAAARYFAIPSVAENPPLLVHIRNLDDARRFNESLPCGARLVRAETQGQFTTATFRLTERPGPGTCGPGTGSAAKTSFVIRDGKIVEWRRIGTGGGGQRAPSQSA
jgi:limonene-1,2-epoxide hydrolase